MEFVLVTFPRVRRVRMDGATQGQTGQVIGVQRGVHIFDLGSPLDYTPPSVQIPVANTTSGTPLVVAFQSAAFAPPSAPPIAMAAPPPKKAAPKRKAASKKSTARKKKATSRKKPAARKMSPRRKKSGRTKTRRTR